MTQNNYNKKLLNEVFKKSMKTRPEMPIEYHLETLRIAAQLIGGKR